MVNIGFLLLDLLATNLVEYCLAWAHKRRMILRSNSHPVVQDYCARIPQKLKLELEESEFGQLLYTFAIKDSSIGILAREIPHTTSIVSGTEMRITN
ncbi:hypothetical protein BDR26DRAFT_861959 [Obelidium mucronatum]|nr:hypothetical protein BDR26DRAFT_861959 [Obelidium mucronatum]